MKEGSGNRVPCFAHMVGLPSHLDPIIFDKSLLPRSARRNPAGAFTVQFKENPSMEGLQRALLGSAVNIRRLFTFIRQLGIPRADITAKFKWHKQAMENPGKAVVLDHDMQRFFAARKEGITETQNLSYRPKPKYRTREPGVKSIIAFNLAFIAFLLNANF